MDMLGHYDITGNRKEIAQTDTFQRIFKKISGTNRREVAATTVTTEGEKVELARLLVADSLACHAYENTPN